MHSALFFEKSLLKKKGNHKFHVRHSKFLQRPRKKRVFTIKNGS